jgi:hypothetical protein
LVKGEEMIGEYTELPCQFCDKGRIQAWYIPGVTSIKRSGARYLPCEFSKSKRPDIWIIKSGCNVCNKYLEVEKKLSKMLKCNLTKN